MAVVFGLNPVQLKLPIRMPVTPDMAVTLLTLGPRWPRKVFGRLIKQSKVPLCLKFWPLETFCNLLRLSLQVYVSNGTRTTRMLSVSDGLRSVGGLCDDISIV